MHFYILLICIGGGGGGGGGGNNFITVNENYIPGSTYIGLTIFLNGLPKQKHIQLKFFIGSYWDKGSKKKHFSLTKYIYILKKVATVKSFFKLFLLQISIPN